jgi:hypothetical protein
MAEDSKAAPPLDIRRHENFENWYTNNVQFQQTEWDVKMVFGQLDWVENHYVVEQHTSMTMSWLQAKMLLYFLGVQVGAYELSHGKIPIPPGTIPPDPEPPTPEQATDPSSYKFYEYIKQKRQEFMADNPTSD